MFVQCSTGCMSSQRSDRNHPSTPMTDHSIHQSRCRVTLQLWTFQWSTLQSSTLEWSTLQLETSRRVLSLKGSTWTTRLHLCWSLWYDDDTNFFDYGEIVLLLHCKIHQTTFKRNACLNASKTDKEENLTSSTHSSRGNCLSQEHQITAPHGTDLSKALYENTKFAFHDLVGLVRVSLISLPLKQEQPYLLIHPLTQECSPSNVWPVSERTSWSHGRLRCSMQVSNGHKSINHRGCSSKAAEKAEIFPLTPRRAQDS